MAHRRFAERGRARVRLRRDDRRIFRILSRAESRRAGSHRRFAIRMMPRMLTTFSRTLGILALGAAVATAACSGGEAVQATQPPSGRGGGQGPAVPVTAAGVQQKAVPLDVQAIGTV